MLAQNLIEVFPVSLISGDQIALHMLLSYSKGHCFVFLSRKHRKELERLGSTFAVERGELRDNDYPVSRIDCFLCCFFFISERLEANADVERDSLLKYLVG